MLSLLTTNPFLFILWLLGLVSAITIHEFAHALAADKLGDPTPRSQGRLTLNPLAHLDPLGTIMLLIAKFGWGKPVIFDPYNLENPKNDSVVIALAGPLSNIILATILSMLVRLSPFAGPTVQVVSTILVPAIFLNVMLAIFNLIPIHPLDGGKILVGLLPDRQAKEVDQFLHKFGTIILIAIILPLNNGNSTISSVISPVIELIINFLLP